MKSSFLGFSPHVSKVVRYKRRREYKGRLIVEEPVNSYEPIVGSVNDYS